MKSGLKGKYKDVIFKDLIFYLKLKIEKVRE